MAKFGGTTSSWRGRARLSAATGLVALLSTIVVVAPYSVAEETAAVSTKPEAAPASDAASPATAARLAAAAADLTAAARAFSLPVAPAAQSDDDDADIDDEDTGASAAFSPMGSEDSGEIESVPALDPSVPAADLSVEIEAERNPVLSESFLSYYVTVTNDGPAEAENVVVAHTIPDYMSFILTNGCWLNNDMWPECHLDEIPAGESKTYEVLVLTSPNSVGDHEFTATAGSETLDPDPTNNEASFTSTINIRASWRDIGATADLAISKIDLVDPVPALGEITYRITVANNGPNAAVDVRATEALPAGVTLVSTTGCATNTGVPECWLGTVPPRQLVSYDVTVSVDAGTVGDITNAVTVSSRSNDTNGSNNTATETTTVQAGTIILEKQTDPDGSTATFTFTDDLAGEIGDGETLEMTNLLDGTYTTTEIIPAGWGIADITCDDTDSAGDPTTGEVTFVVTGDEVVRCVVTNALLGSVTIEKDTLGTDGTFGFDGDFGAFDLTTTGGTASTTFTDLLPGAYSVTEDDPTTAFYLTALDCTDDDGGSTGDIVTRTASIDLDAGENVTCTFTNSEAGSVTIEKTTIGADGAFDFSGDLGTASVSTSSNFGDLTISDVAPGTYDLTENTKPAFALTGLTCVDPDSGSTTDLASATATIDIDPGENVTCSFENTELATLVVEKQTLPDGDPQTFEFTGDAADTIGDGETITVDGLLPGTYSSTEVVPAGWALTDITCDDGASATASSGDTGTATATFELEAGEVVTCVFTNTKDGLIVVEKQTLPDGSTETFEFTGDINDTIGDGETASAAVAPGNYTATETVPAGWAITDITCDDGASATASSGNTATGAVTFNVEPGETVACVFENTELSTIIVRKQTDPDQPGGSYTFSGAITGTIANGETLETTDLLPGEYTVTEADPSPAFDLTNIICDDGGSDTESTGDVASRTATFRVDPGETITCVFTNTQRGTIIVEKQTLPDAAPGSFSFSGDATGTIADDGDITVTELVPGTYTVTETDPQPGFDLTNIVCDDDSSPTASSGDIPTRTATFELDPGETITCVFTNTQRGNVYLEKQTLPDGDPQSFEFTGDAAGTIADNGTIDVLNVVPGTHTATETVPDGWELTDITCDDSGSATASSGDVGTATATFEVDPGETVRCVFTNTKDGRILVRKQTIPGGTGQFFSFTGAITASIGDGVSTGRSIAPGTHTVTEQDTSGWQLTDITCDDGGSVTVSSVDVGTSTATYEVDPGETVTCTFENTQLGTLVVAKETLPDGSSQAFDFTGDATGTISDGDSFSVEVLPGAYDVTETVPAGWDVTDVSCNDGNSTGDTGTATASFIVESAETVTCTFTNTQRGTITVLKETVPAGAPGDFVFTGDAAGTIAHGESIVVDNLVPGTYTSTETPLAGFDLTDITCNDTDSTGDTGTGEATFEIDPGEDVTCTFTNTQRGTIIVEKQTLPDGALGDFDFTGDAAGTISDDETIVVDNLLPGTYTSTETPLAGFDLTDITCDDISSPSNGNIATRTATFNVEPGETVRCVFTNTQRGTIIVEKATLPTTSTGIFDFIFTGAGTISGALNANGEQLVTNDLVPGTYTATESVPTGWDLTDISCVDSETDNSTTDLANRRATFELDPGETVTCTFENTERGTISIETLTDPPNEPGSFDYTGAITATHVHGDVTQSAALEPGQYEVTQGTPPAGLPLSDISCSDTNSSGDVGTATATFELDPGEDVTCTFTNSVPGSITITKLSVAGNGVFDFTGDLGAFSLDTTAPTAGMASTTFNDVEVGAYDVVESDPSPAVLTGLACNDTTSATPSTTDLGLRTATVNVDAAENVVCTFTNSFNLPPNITGGPTAAVSVDENQTAVTDVDSTDSFDSEGSGLTYSLTTESGGGVDNALFSVDPNTGAVTFDTAPDFENPTDDDNNGVYEVQVTVTDSGGLTDFQDISVTVLDVNDPPVVTTSAGASDFIEAAGPIAVDGAVTVTDQDAGAMIVSATVTITNLLDGADEVLACGACGALGFVSVTYSSGLLTISGVQTPSAYQTALQSVTYDNASLTPDETDRVIEFIVNDGTADSDPATKTVTVTAVNSPPTATDDSYSNVPVNVVLDAGVGEAGIDVDGGNGVLDNDTDPEGDGLTVTGIVGCAAGTAPFVCASTGGGTVTMNADGTFTFVSAPGSAAPSDTFTYTVSDDGSPVESDTGTVTINFTATTIWFLDSNAPGGGNGTSKSPFNSVSSFNSTAADESGDIIYLHPGSFSELSGFSLLNNQQLIGAGVELSVTGLTIPAVSRPTLIVTTGNGVSLGANNTVRGLNIGDTPAGTGIVGSNVGTPTIDTIDITGTGGILNLNGVNTSNIALGTQSSLNAFESGIRLDNANGTYAGGAPTITTPTQHGIQINGGNVSATFTGGTITHTSTNTSNDGIRIVSNTGTANIAIAVTKTNGGNPVEVSGGSGTKTFTGTIAGTGSQGILVNNSGTTVAFNAAVDITNSTNTGAAITGNTGTVTFADLDVNNSTSNQPAIVGTGAGTLNITTGTANGGEASAVDVNGSTLGVSLTSVNSSGGTQPGIELRGTSGSFSATGGTIANKNGGDLTAGAKSATGEGIGVYIDGANNVTLSGMTINGTMQNFGIRGFDLTGTTNFTNLTMDGSYGNNEISDEGGVVLNGVTGTFNVSGGSYEGGHEDVFSVANTSGTLNMNVTGVTFNASSLTNGDNALQIRTISPGSGTLNLSVQGSTFNAARSVMLFVDVAGSGGGTVNVGNTTANTFTQGQANLPSGGAIEVLSGGTNNTATVSMNIANNVITAGSNTFEGDTLVVGSGSGFAGTTNIRVTGNRIGRNGENGSAVNPAVGSGDSGIGVSHNGTGTMNALISNNQVYDFNRDGIEIFYDAEGPSSPSGGTFNITVTNNTVTDAVGGNLESIGFIGNHTVNSCMHVAGNTVNNPAGEEIVVDTIQTAASVFQVVGFTDGPLANLWDDLEVHWAAANGGLVPETDVKVFTPFNPTITGVSSCPTPP